MRNGSLGSFSSEVQPKGVHTLVAAVGDGGSTADIEISFTFQQQQPQPQQAGIGGSGGGTVQTTSFGVGVFCPPGVVGLDGLLNCTR